MRLLCLTSLDVLVLLELSLDVIVVLDLFRCTSLC